MLEVENSPKVTMYKCNNSTFSRKKQKIEATSEFYHQKWIDCRKRTWIMAKTGTLLHLDGMTSTEKKKTEKLFNAMQFWQ